MIDYDSLHKEWDIVHFTYESPTYRLRKKIILQTIYRLFPETREYSCLDVGCGTGDYSLELARKNFRVKGFDFSGYAISQAMKKAEIRGTYNVHFFKDDIGNFSTEEKFDLVLISEVLEHVIDDFTMLYKYSTYVKDSGYILFSVPFDPLLWSFEDDNAGHVRRYSLERINEMIRVSGMSPVVSICYGFPLLYLLWRVKSFFPNTKQRTKVPFNPIKCSITTKYIGRMILLVDLLFINSKFGVGIIVAAKQKNISLTSNAQKIS